MWPAIALDGATPVVAWQDNRFDRDPLWTGGASYGEGTDPDDWQIAVFRPGRDEAPVFLGDGEAADRHPDLIVDTGHTHVVWDSKPLRFSGANLRLLAAHDFTEPQPVAEEPAASAHRPRLGLDAAGVPRLSWFDSRSADWRWRVMLATYDDAQWGDASLLDSRGINTWPVPVGPYTVLASARHARRLQRDRSQQIFVVDSAQPATRAATVAAAALPKTLRLAAPVEPDEDCLHIPSPAAPTTIPRWTTPP